MMLNETHDPGLQSWVESANHPGSDFPIQNLPHAVFRRRDTDEEYRGGVAIGDYILDMRAASELGVFAGPAAVAAGMAGNRTLNGLMALGPEQWSALRLALSRLLRHGAPAAERLRDCLVKQADAEFAVPAHIGDFTDFLTSQYHALNGGRIFNPANPLLPNFKWLPIAYHGRSSSIEVSGAAFHRPLGQTRAPDAEAPVFGPSRRLDYELELGIFIGQGNRRGEPVCIDDAERQIFGMCLVNDWSARDIQGWEMMPLGPFMAKNFLTTISPWIVTAEALAPFRVAPVREAGDPPTLPYLRQDAGSAPGGFDIQLETWLKTTKSGDLAHRLNRTSYRHSYWTPAQLIAHHTWNGCNLCPGDLLGTGTQSGPERGEEGSLMELSYGGKEPYRLPDGQTRAFLEDGDCVILRGWCEREGFARIGFGECSGKVLPAITVQSCQRRAGPDQ
jgi:fumarylacetoacetase